MEGAKFNFVLQQERQSFLTNKKVADKLMQWSMRSNIKLKYYNFNQQYQPYHRQDFVDAFFRDPSVYSSLETYNTSSSTWSPLGNVVDKVHYELVPSTELSMSFFDRVLDPGNNIVREGGEIRQCFEEVVSGFYLSNHLSTMLVDERNPLHQLYSSNERKEFLFRLLSHLVLGGEWCQWDDSIDPYLDVVRVLYKELLSVEREEGTNKIRIRSEVLKVECFDAEGRPLVPPDPGNLQDFCYLIVDPSKRTLATFTHSYRASFTS